MSRTHRIFAAIGSGYAAQVANMISVGVSIPLALHYLNPSQFGLWAVAGQVAGYLTLADLGFSQSVARVLIDHKDDMRTGQYGAILKASFIIFTLIAVVIFGTGLLSGKVLAQVLKVDPQMVGPFRILFAVTSGVVAVSMLVQPFSLPLWSHQRSDLVNYTNVFTHFTTLTVLWITLHLGFSYYSLAITSVAGTLVYTIGTTFWSIRLGLIPPPRYWGHLTGEMFKDVARLSRDFFLLSIASQLTSATQVIIVSNVLGLEAAGIWTVCNKVFAVAMQGIARFYDFSIPAFSEMFVRHETDKLKQRLSNVVSLTAVTAGTIAVLGACGNRDFIQSWTGGKVTWDAASDLGAAIYLFLFLVSRCYTGTTGVIKRVGAYRYLALLEGFSVVFGRLLLGQHLSFAGIFLASIVANLLCSGIYGVSLVSRTFGATWQEVTWGWLHRSFGFILIYGCCASLIFHFANAKQGWGFYGTAVIAGCVGAGLAWFVGLSPELRHELRGMVGRIAGRNRFVRVSPAPL